MFLPAHLWAQVYRSEIIRCGGREAAGFPCAAQMVSARVDKDSIPDVCGWLLLSCRHHPLLPAHAHPSTAAATRRALPSLPLSPPGDWCPLPHVHLSVLPTPPSVSNCFPSPRECCGFEMMVFNHFLSDQPRNHFLVPYTQIKS